MISYNGSIVESCYSQHFDDEHSAHPNRDNEYVMGDSHSNLNKFIITLFILHMLQ
jgi:hypothetical protein